MRDLAARLRSIVRQDHGGSASHAPHRELTYIPDVVASTQDPGQVAAALGGTLLDSGGGCVVIDRVWEPDEWHGTCHRHATAHGHMEPAPGTDAARFCHIRVSVPWTRDRGPSLSLTRARVRRRRWPIL